MEMDMAKATKRQGSELFFVDGNGKRQDAPLHEEILGPEGSDPFAFDLDEFAAMSPGEQEQFLASR